MHTYMRTFHVPVVTFSVVVLGGLDSSLLLCNRGASVVILSVACNCAALVSGLDTGSFTIINREYH